MAGIPKALRDKDKRRARAEELSVLDDGAILDRHAGVIEERDGFVLKQGPQFAQVCLDIELLEEEMDRRGLAIPE